MPPSSRRFPDNLRRRLGTLAVSALALAPLEARSAAPPELKKALRFRSHKIADFPGAYQVSVADLSGDGRPDVVALAEKPGQFAWFEAPGWKKHALAPKTDRFIDVAPLDVDGDKRVDLAFASAFDLRNSETGLVSWMHAGDKPDSWTTFDIEAAPSSHRIRWADVDGDGRKELVNAPLLGRGAKEPDYAVPARLVLYRPPAPASAPAAAPAPPAPTLTAAAAPAPKPSTGSAPPALAAAAPAATKPPAGSAAPSASAPATPAPATAMGPWKPELIDGSLHVIHAVRVVNWDEDPAEELLTASFEGVHVHDYAQNRGANPWTTTRLVEGEQAGGPKRGASEVALGLLGDRATPAARNKKAFLATIEPWHGDKLVVYTRTADASSSKSGGWRRVLVDDTLVDAHALAVADFDGDGRDDIVAGFRGRGRRLSLYRAADAAGTRWERQILDDGDMACNGVFIADVNLDGRPDIVAGGGGSENVKWYENLGPPDPSENATLLILEKLASRLGFYRGDGTPLGHVDVGKHPHEMVLAPDNRTLAISDNGVMRMTFAGEGGNTISLVDIRDRNKIGIIDLGKFRRPHGLDLDRRTWRMVVTSENPDRLAVVDLKARKVVRDFETFGQKPHMVTLGPGARVAFVSNSNSNAVGAIDLSTGKVTVVQVGTNPQGSVVSRDGRELYVTTRDGVSVVDTKLLKQVARISQGRNTNRVALAHDGRTLIYSGDAVEFADARTRKVLGRVDTPFPTVSLTLSPDGQRAYASAEEQNLVFVVSVKTRKVIRTLSLPEGSGPDPVLELGRAAPPAGPPPAAP